MSDFLPSLPDLVPVAPQSTPSSFHHVTVEEHVSLLPCYVGQLSKGIIEHLNRKVLRYCDDYGGVLLSYSRPTVLQHCGRILDEQPHIHLQVKYDGYIFKPAIDDIMCGTINRIGDGHIGCLVHQCFNASVISHRTSQTSRRSLNGWFDTGQFELGAEIWFRVYGLENVSGILVIQGEYCDLSGLIESSTTHEGIDCTATSSSNRIKEQSQVEVNSNDDDSSCHVLTTKKKKKRKKHRTTDSDDVLRCHGDSETTVVLSTDEGEGRKQKKRKRKTKDRDLEVGVATDEEVGVVSKRTKKRKKAKR